ncbi:MAG TPA: hypothetical protein VIT93_01915 [Dehalococcoidia bacterium]
MLSFATEEMIGYKLKELKAEAGRLRVSARAKREERTSPPRVAVYRSHSASLKELAIEPTGA